MPLKLMADVIADIVLTRTVGEKELRCPAWSSDVHIKKAKPFPRFRDAEEDWLGLGRSYGRPSLIPLTDLKRRSSRLYPWGSRGPTYRCIEEDHDDYFLDGAADNMFYQTRRASWTYDELCDDVVCRKDPGRCNVDFENRGDGLVIARCHAETRANDISVANWMRFRESSRA